MSEHSAIEWTDDTHNPWWGCTKVSDGWKNCYAEGLAKRFGGDIWGPGRERRTFGANHWHNPILWDRRAQRAGRRRRVFCASMADVFDDEGPVAERERLWRLIDETPNLDWQLLTKRPAEMQGFRSSSSSGAGGTRRRPGGCWTASSMTSSRRRHSLWTTSSTSEDGNDQVVQNPSSAAELRPNLKTMGEGNDPRQPVE